MITMVSTIANGGAYIQPRVVKQIVSKTTGEVEENPIIKRDRVISEETSKNMLSMMLMVREEMHR